MRIAISGAGVAGPAAAHWLVRDGHEVLLVEQAPRFRTGGYLVDFWGVGYTVAERMGILPAVRDAGYFVREVRFVDGRGRKSAGLEVESFRSVTGDRFVSVPRGQLSLAAYSTLQGKVETLFGDSIASVEDTGSAVRVGFRQHPAREFDLLIGADGLHSEVRRLVFGPLARYEKHLDYYVAAFEAEGYPQHDELVYIMQSTPGRQISRFTLRGGRTMFLFIFHKDHLPGPEPRGVVESKAVLQAVFQDAGWEARAILAAMQGVPEVYFDRVSQIHMDTWSKGRVVLVGDAAACVSLLAGEGTGLALTEAYVLAAALREARGDHVQAFRSYERQLRTFVEGKQRGAVKLAPSFAPKTAARIWLRDRMVNLMARPALARLFLGRVLRDDFQLPEWKD